MKKRIALLYGGADSEHDVSVMGYEYVRSLLNESDYEILPVYISRDGAWLIKENGSELRVYPTAKSRGSLYTGHHFIKIDAAIPLLHGEGGEDGTVQGALECSGIPYVGADVVTSAVCLDKSYAKALAESLGIPTVRGVSPKKHASVEDALALARDAIGFPLFIKPRRLGSSVGAYSAMNEDDFKKFYPLSAKLGGGLVLIEKYLAVKRELECAFVESGGERIVTPPAEVMIGGFYGYREKYEGRTKTDPRAHLDEETAKRVTEYARKIADAAALRHLGRIDFFLADGEIYFNEINTFPGFTKESLYPRMLERYGIAPREAMLSFIEDALSW
jgi:D-alanine-D-alanine ligase